MWKDRILLSRKIEKGKIISFDRSQTSERLKLVGFGCNRCGWTIKKTSIEYYHTALAEHGKHNLTNHRDDLSSSTTFLYQEF